MKRLKSYILEHFEGALIMLILLGIIAIASLVHYKLSFLNFFFLPVILSGYFLGKRQAVLTAFFCVLLVVFYLIFSQTLFGEGEVLNFDMLLNIIVWGGFLVLTGAVLGIMAEQREAKMRNMRRAYVGVLEIMLKYLEVADETKPRSLRVSLLSGKIAQAAGLSKREVENIKSAALLYEAGDLRTNLPLFREVVDYIGKEKPFSGAHLEERTMVMLTTTASLLKDVEPILSGYFHHYVEEAGVVDKKLEDILPGSSILCLADIYDRLITNSPLPHWKEEIKSLEDIERLKGRTFPVSCVQALFQVII